MTKIYRGPLQAPMRLYHKRQWRESYQLTTRMPGPKADRRPQDTWKSLHLEEAFSADGGKTWEPNWIVNVTSGGRRRPHNGRR